MTWIKFLTVSCLDCGIMHCQEVDDTTHEFYEWVEGDNDDKPCPNCKRKKEAVLIEIGKEEKDTE